MQRGARVETTKKDLMDLVGYNYAVQDYEIGVESVDLRSVMKEQPVITKFTIPKGVQNE